MANPQLWPYAPVDQLWGAAPMPSAAEMVRTVIVDDRSMLRATYGGFCDIPGCAVCTHEIAEKERPR